MSRLAQVQLSSSFASQNIENGKYHVYVLPICLPNAPGEATTPSPIPIIVLWFDVSGMNYWRVTFDTLFLKINPRVELPADPLSWFSLRESSDLRSSNHRRISWLDEKFPCLPMPLLLARFSHRQCKHIFSTIFARCFLEKLLQLLSVIYSLFLRIFFREEAFARLPEAGRK